MFRVFFFERTLLGGPSGTILLVKTGDDEDPVKKPMPHAMLIEAYVEASQQKRKHVGTTSVLNNVETITSGDIMINNPSDWFLLPVGPTTRIYDSFKGCSVPLYECIFTKLAIHFPFFDFDVVVMDRLRVPPCIFIMELRLS